MAECALFTMEPRVVVASGEDHTSRFSKILIEDD